MKCIYAATAFIVVIAVSIIYKSFDESHELTGVGY